MVCVGTSKAVLFTSVCVVLVQSGYIAKRLVSIMLMDKVRASDECGIGTKLCSSTKPR